MEPRAHHLVIGSFVLLITAALFGFIIWLAKINIDQEYVRYDIYFEGSVEGLSLGGDVRYNGLPVGSIKVMEIDPKDPRRVRVVIDIASDTPVREDTFASMEFQGWTGVSYVQLVTVGESQIKLTAKEGEPYPVIRSRRSAFQELFAGGPDLINAGILLFARITEVFNEDNRAAISGVLANLNEVTGVLAGDKQRLISILAEAERAAAGISGASRSIEKFTQNLDALADDEIRALSQVSRETLGALKSLSGELESLVSANRAALTAFATQDLPQVTRFFTEAREVLALISRIAEQFEENPTGFLLGRGQKSAGEEE